MPFLASTLRRALTTMLALLYANEQSLTAIISSLKINIMKNFENKMIVITGAAMGLGFAAAKELAARGANLTLVDYNEKSLEEAKAEIQKEYTLTKILTVVADVSKEDAVKNYVDQTVKTFGRIDGLYNNAG